MVAAINFETVRFLRSTHSGIESLIVFDADPKRSAKFAARAAAEWDDVRVSIVDSSKEALSSARLISIATTATAPHIQSIQGCGAATILHISLRDLPPEAILSADNVVDDIKHVLTANTSVHVTQKKGGHADFIRCTLTDIISGRYPAKPKPESPTVFSPFGLGILDVALAGYSLDRAGQTGGGTIIPQFFSEPW